VVFSIVTPGIQARPASLIKGETGQTDAVQREADSRYWSASPCRPCVRLLIVIADGVVCRIWPVDAGTEWIAEPGGTRKFILPLAGHPLDHD